MTNSWGKMKENRRKRRKGNDTYTFADFTFDLLFYIPELVLFPFRIIFWFVRGLGKVIVNLFDNF